MTERLARACSRHPWRTIGAWIGALVLASALIIVAVFAGFAKGAARPLELVPADLAGLAPRIQIERAPA